ncbi:MAG: signal peptidase I [archaeon]
MHKEKKKPKTLFGKVWYFIWDDDSVLSWIVNIVLAFILIKYLIYPGLGFLLGTTHPVVAVVSGSMDHRLDDRKVICGQIPEGYKTNFDGFWDVCGEYYRSLDIDKPEFDKFIFSNGFSKGDIIVLLGTKPDKIKVGDVLVFRGARSNSKADPIIHRIVKITDTDGRLIFRTKGDHNADSINGCFADGCIFESDIYSEQVIGKAVFRIPFLGNIKIWFVEFLKLLKLDKSVGGLFN